VDEHQDNGGVTKAGFGEESEGVGMVEELIAKRPINANG
jgi:hypothetical protein